MQCDHLFPSCREASSRLSIIISRIYSCLISFRGGVISGHITWDLFTTAHGDLVLYSLGRFSWCGISVSLLVENPTYTFHEFQFRLRKRRSNTFDGISSALKGVEWLSIIENHIQCTSILFNLIDIFHSFKVAISYVSWRSDAALERAHIINNLNFFVGKITLVLPKEIT